MDRITGLQALLSIVLIVSFGVLGYVDEIPGEIAFIGIAGVGASLGLWTRVKRGGNGA